MLARFTAARRLPQLFAVRYSSSQVEGSVAKSKEFSKKEKAHEDEYIHRHEMEQLAKMRKQIEQKKAELEALEKEREALEKKA
ncbi:hypothetical protein AMATHDRAFT_61176 [Amanita thiersii Skay4041]|uniref:ATPase inhibitor, mitochondrial n=1 Tax=Amanita thiersii Skay4041 TaxID=703135 RepID=A0A2A9NIE6_9AGAR|nr:hypothetical protein AMATHDRAFT_61176 [Amanita thiersii Skay4041]